MSDAVEAAREVPILFGVTDAAREVGVSPSAIRLWERQGLIEPRRTKGGARRYTPADLARLRTIHRLRYAERLNAPAIRRILATGDATTAPSPDAVSGPLADVATPWMVDGPGPSRSDLANRLRNLRTRQALTLRQAAERSGLSISFISSLERGVTGASISALRRLTDAYGATMADLLRDPTFGAERLARAGDRRVLDAGGGVWIEDLATAPSQLESQLFVLAPGASSDGSYSHAGEEFMYVLSGSIAVWLGDAEHYQLAPGDALTFPSTLSHRFEALGATETRVIWVNTPPTF